MWLTSSVRAKALLHLWHFCVSLVWLGFYYAEAEELANLEGADDRKFWLLTVLSECAASE